MSMNPLKGWQVDRSQIGTIGTDLQRPECILAQRDGSLLAADARGGVMRIEPDGTIVIGARDPEVGQGIRTAEARIIAEEMDADWPRVLVLPMTLGVEDAGNGEPRWTLGHQEARGSTGVPAAWNDLRIVGASARELLVRAAAQRFGVDARVLRTQPGKVIAPDGRSLGYGELAADASTLPPPNALGSAASRARTSASISACALADIYSSASPTPI